MPAYSMTPRSYVAKIRKYPVGDPRRDVAVRRAALAVQAARAASAGDGVTARRSLEGLHALSRFGDIDPDALAARIRFRAAGDVSTTTSRRIATTITAIAGIASAIFNLIALALPPDVARVFRFVDALLMGRAPAEALENADFIAFCRVWNGMSGGFSGVANGIIAGAVFLNAEQRSNLRDIAAWIKLILDSICSEVGPVPPLPAPVPEPPPTTVQRPDPPPPTPEAAAWQRWRRAVVARTGVELALVSPASTSTAAAQARARDASSAAELCAAETALLGYVDMLPAWGTQPSPAIIEQATRVLTDPALGPTATASQRLAAGLRVVFAVTPLYAYLPPSAQPRCYIRTPPTGGCSCPRVRRSGGGSDSGGIIKVALPAALLLWYMTK